VRISLDWIGSLLGIEALPVDAGELVPLLSRRVAEIDALERTAASIPGVVVGEVLDCAPHPDADRLRVCTVRTAPGADPLPIVCGAPNVASGQKVAVATVGTVLEVPDEDGQPTRLKVRKSKLRGQRSHGMICSECELGLGEDHGGILVLPGDAEPGTDLADALPGGDSVLVIDNHAINHRPDLWGHVGWAREIAAVLELPPPEPPELELELRGDGMAVAIRDPRCRVYAGALLTGVANRPSPGWMRARLEAVGIRSLGLLVDVTNYVMCELGEPMHAFDRRHIAGDEIVVRAAGAGERVVALDGGEHELAEDDLVIADRDKNLALAGIIGGEGSMVADDTDSLVLEAACFDPTSVRRTRVRTGVATESSNRFEKGLYPELATLAIRRAIQLLTSELPDAAVVCRFRAGEPRQASFELRHDPCRTAALMGIDIPAAEQEAHLARLGFEVDGQRVAVPWWRRKDQAAPIDLVEEVGRLHGYEHIREELPRMRLRPPAGEPRRDAAARIRTALTAAGWDEVATYVFASRAWAERLGWRDVLGVRNAATANQEVMRRELLPNLGEAAVHNRRWLDRVAIFELGEIYGRDVGADPRRHERTVCAGAFCAVGEQTPFYEARDAAMECCRRLGAAPEIRECDQQAHFTAGRAADLVVDGRTVATAGELSGPLREVLDCADRIAFFTVDLEAILALGAVDVPARYRPPSRYPGVEREFTFVCPEPLRFAEVAGAAAAGARDLYRDHELITVYRGDPIPDGSKAMSLRLRLQADDRTLSDKELRRIGEKIVRAVERATPARLRS